MTDEERRAKMEALETELEIIKLEGDLETALARLRFLRGKKDPRLKDILDQLRQIVNEQ